MKEFGYVGGYGATAAATGWEGTIYPSWCSFCGRIDDLLKEHGGLLLFRVSEMPYTANTVIRQDPYN